MKKQKVNQKIERINHLFDTLEAQIKDQGLDPNIEERYFFLNETHRDNFDLVQTYYSNIVTKPYIEAQCYLLALPDIYDNVNIFDYDEPLDWVFNGDDYSEVFHSLSIYNQNIVQIGLEANGVLTSNPTGFAQAMSHFNIEQMKVFWQFTAIHRKEAL